MNTSKAAGKATQIVIRAGDGYALTAQLFEPCADSAPCIKRVVLVNSATGVPQGYYRAYANYLRSQGFTVLTYDYRGIGLSKDPHWKGKPLSMTDWGRQDLDSIIVWLHQKFPQHRLLAVGHSVGGQLVGLSPNNHLLDGVLAIGSQAGYVGYWDGLERLKFKMFTYVVIPGVTRLVGDLPASVLGSEPLPRGVARQWALWCRNPHYMVDKQGQPIREHFEQYSNHLRMIHFSDDSMYAPYKAVEALRSFYKNAQSEVLSRRPEDFGLKAIGHFGFFKRTMPQSAWQETAEWLRQPYLSQDIKTVA
jgi:predicted alpha/beta hydrolase